MRETRPGNRATMVVTWSMLVMLPVAALAQAGSGGSGAGVRQGFEVASVRPNARRPTTFAGALGSMRVMPGGGFVATGASLKDLIRLAYALEGCQEVDAGRWSSLLEQRFDVEAKSGAGDVPRTITPGVIGPINIMVQHFLAERFRPPCPLGRARAAGARTRWSAPGREARSRASSLISRLRGSGNEEKGAANEAASGGCTFRGTNGRLQAAGHSMSAFAEYLSRRLQRPVFDRTNLDGPFVIDMTSSSEGIPTSPLTAQLTPVRTDDAAPDSRPPLTMALKEQLGLALEERKERIPRLVIEHVAAPSPN